MARNPPTTQETYGQYVAGLPRVSSPVTTNPQDLVAIINPTTTAGRAATVANFAGAGPVGPAGPTGPQGPAGSGTSIGVNVLDFGATGTDRTYSNIVGGSGYTGGSASNLVTHPEDATAWNKVNVTVTANAIPDPRGNLLADAVTETVANDVHTLADSLGSSFTGGSTLRYVVEIKPNLRTWVSVAIQDNTNIIQTTFNLTGSGTVGSSFEFGGTITNSSIVALANGWYRCTIEGTCGDNTTTQVKPQIFALLGDLIFFNGINDPNEIYTGNSGSVAFYMGLSQVYAITTYLGAVYIAAENVYSGVPLTGGSGTGAQANIVVGLGQVLSVYSYCPGNGYVIGDTLSCSAADIGGTGSGFTCQVQTIGNDTAAIQAALDSGNNAPTTVYFPPGTYNIFPPDNLGSHCLILRRSNVRMQGGGRSSSVIQAFVSGGRHPATSYDYPVAGIAWRGSGFFVQQFISNITWEGLRITALCPRSNNRWPFSGSDPTVIGNTFPQGFYGDGDGWDTSHHAIVSKSDAQVRGMRILDCEVDSWKGEIINAPGSNPQTADSRTQWAWWLVDSYLHDCNADAVSVDGNCMIVLNEIGWVTNATENEGLQAHNIFKLNHVHDCRHGVAPVTDIDQGAATTGTGQTIINENLLERAYHLAVFINNFQVNTVVDNNVMVDSGVDGGAVGGAVGLSLLSGAEPYANVFVRRNIMYNHTRHVVSPVQVGMSSFNNPSLVGVYIEENVAAQTPNAQSLGYQQNFPWSVSLGPGTRAEFIRNDSRTALSAESNAFAGGVRYSFENVFDQQTRYNEVHQAVSQLDVANNTLVDIPGFIEAFSDSTGQWFEALLFINAPAGGAKVAVVGSSAPFAARYDVELWAGTTIDAASGQSTSQTGTFGSNAAITKIKISGYWEYNTGNQGDTLKLQFAENSTNATVSSVLTGSWFKVRNR